MSAKKSIQTKLDKSEDNQNFLQRSTDLDSTLKDALTDPKYIQKYSYSAKKPTPPQEDNYSDYLKSHRFPNDNNFVRTRIKQQILTEISNHKRLYQGKGRSKSQNPEIIQDITAKQKNQNFEMKPVSKPISPFRPARNMSPYEFIQNTLHERRRTHQSDTRHTESGNLSPLKMLNDDTVIPPQSFFTQPTPQFRKTTLNKATINFQPVEDHMLKPKRIMRETHKGHTFMRNHLNVVNNNTIDDPPLKPWNSSRVNILEPTIEFGDFNDDDINFMSPKHNDD